MRHPRRLALAAVLAAFGLTGLWACAASRSAEPGAAEKPAGEAPEQPGPEAGQAPDGTGTTEGTEAGGPAAPESQAQADEQTGAQPGGPEKPGHPQVPEEADCFQCHQQTTPEIADAWKRSPHGMALVKCFVCHGSTGEDFVASPEPTSCSACHPTEADSVGGTGCFGCHEPHTLAAQGDNPHQDGGAQ